MTTKTTHVNTQAVTTTSNLMTNPSVLHTVQTADHPYEAIATKPNTKKMIHVTTPAMIHTTVKYQRRMLTAASYMGRMKNNLQGKRLTLSSRLVDNVTKT